jgi:hypothetical protein
VFSPAKYGKHNASMLNSLQWAMHNTYHNRCSPYGKWCEYSSVLGDGPASGLFAEATGSALEADYLTLSFVHRPAALYGYNMHYSMINLSDDPKKADITFALFELFMPEFAKPGGTRESDRERYIASYSCKYTMQQQATRGVAEKVMQLRRRLYRQPRMEAFLSGMHGRLGEGSLVHSLSDDLCKRILELSFVE